MGLPVLRFGAGRARLAASMINAREHPMTSTPDIATPFRELARRDADGIDVTLLWDACDDRAFVVVVDRKHGESFDVEVGAANAMHVFHHPYAYREYELAA
jgi:hypothetical protein